MKKMLLLCYCVFFGYVSSAYSTPSAQKINGICEKCNRTLTITLSPYEMKDGQIDLSKYGLCKDMPYEQVIKILGKPKAENIYDFYRYSYYPDGLMIYFSKDSTKNEYKLGYCENTNTTIICPYCGRVQDWRKASSEYSNTRYQQRKGVGTIRGHPSR